MPSVESLGIYATWQTVLAQVILLALFVFAVAKTFWPKRSVTLPTVAPATAASSDTVSIAAELARLRDENEALKARLTAIEAVVSPVEAGDSRRQ
jgi:hypothetical protein